MILSFNTSFGYDLFYTQTIYRHNVEEIRITKSRMMRMAGHVARMWEKRNAHRLLVGKPEGKRPLARPRRRWVDNIKKDLGEVGLG
jgi:hypothetical protein